MDIAKEHHLKLLELALLPSKPKYQLVMHLYGPNQDGNLVVVDETDGFRVSYTPANGTNFNMGNLEGAQGYMSNLCKDVLPDWLESHQLVPSKTDVGSINAHTANMGQRHITRALTIDNMVVIYEPHLVTNRDEIAEYCNRHDIHLANR
jgi:hypothetical protein